MRRSALPVALVKLSPREASERRRFAAFRDEEARKNNAAW
jgi:hypothetical protein